MPFGGKTNFDLMDNIKSGIKARVPPGTDVAARSLIDLMTCVEATSRPAIDGIIHHPFFWGKQQRLNFIEVVSDHLHSGRWPRICQVLEDSREVILGSIQADWVDILRYRRPDLFPLIEYLENPPHRISARYEFWSVNSLLRAIRNISHHYDTLPMDIQATLGIGEGGSPKTIVSEVFFDIFPCMLVGTWYTILGEIGRQPAGQQSLKDFYHDSWVRYSANVNFNVNVKLRGSLRACAAQLTATANRGPPAAEPSFQGFLSAQDLPLPPSSQMQARAPPPLFVPQGPMVAAQMQPRPSTTSLLLQNNMGELYSLPHQELHQDLHHQWQDVRDRGIVQIPNHVPPAVGCSNSRNHRVPEQLSVPKQPTVPNGARKPAVSAATTRPHYSGAGAANGNHFRTT